MTAFWWRLIVALSALMAVLLGVLIAILQTWAVGTTGGLMGEEMMDSHRVARDYADRSIAEAYSIWSEPASNWQVMHNQSNLIAEARRVTEGPLAKSSVLLTRAKGLIYGATAEQVYSFLTSPQGFAVIDTGSDPEDFSKYVERIPGWKSGQARLEVAEAYFNEVPFALERSFVVLNSFVPEELIFVSKSVTHKNRPGSSAHYEAGDAGDDGKRVRALNSFALQVESRNGGEDIVVLNVVNYINLFLLHDALSTYIACKGFFPDLFDRLQQVIENGEHVTNSTTMTY